MLHDEHGIAEIAQALQGVEQAGVVPLVQADGGLVQHIEHARQARADLRGEADALALAARQGAGRPRQGQVVQPHLHQEPQAIVDLLQDAAGDLLLLRREGGLEIGEPLQGFGDRQQRGLADVDARDLHGQRFGLQAKAVADLARGLRLVAAELFPHPGRVGLPPAALQVRQHALERLGDLVFARLVVVDELDLLRARALQHDPVRAHPAARARACPWRSRSGGTRPAASGCRAARGRAPTGPPRPCAGSSPGRAPPGRRRRSASGRGRRRRGRRRPGR